jgi:type I restriction enzyme S subunit
MRSKYKRIGDFIQLVDERNCDLSVNMLLGLSIDKIFIPSVANTVGSDMANYKVIRKWQFACSLMQVRRDKKIPVAMLKDLDEAIISQAYPVFEIKNTSELLPEYLMMWMSRSEFDREACFYAVGGVRGSLDWEDFCNMTLPVPCIEKQREIVWEYRTILDRIKLNEQLNQKLEETAQAIYKQWFVDFEFPISNEYAAEIGKPELEGKPYKSSGGKMVWNDELEREIPYGWDITLIGKLGSVVTGKTPSSNTPEHFGDEVPFVTPTDYKSYFKFAIGSDRLLSMKGANALKNKIMDTGSLLVTCIGSDMGKVIVASEPCITNQQINSIRTDHPDLGHYLYYYLKSIYSDLRNMAIGSSTMLMINKTEFENVPVLEPDSKTVELFAQVDNIFDKIIKNKSHENK